MSYSVAPLALDDLDDIHAYVEDVDDEAAADELIDELYNAFERIGANPGLGHRRRDLTDFDVYFWTALKWYAVIYRKGDPIEVVRVIPWRRMEPVLLTPAGGLWM
ncbi:type II toxin-antitoxin system RelE/ParE family toxin [Azospirillum rugosum]|uniref:Plasmid stabilization system protein ParE n=1 Tax=Azospirillum rugosum TaxID=416170 RepID=A0ABS4SLL0_9PROT|nr:type II toxin-antitoxin system RelE/ParE family toxin [Azospirillum rugosum]MBP2293119.1 plasmid stabilization system protein ParE [Azospirillum rugosum]MDQ0526668.1 plasmid stabilization system protein ParE [Azospirillum rugosum]